MSKSIFIVLIKLPTYGFYFYPWSSIYNVGSFRSSYTQGKVKTWSLRQLPLATWNSMGFISMRSAFSVYFFVFNFLLVSLDSINFLLFWFLIILVMFSSISLIFFKLLSKINILIWRVKPNYNFNFAFKIKRIIYYQEFIFTWFFVYFF